MAQRVWIVLPGGRIKRWKSSTQKRGGREFRPALIGTNSIGGNAGRSSVPCDSVAHMRLPTCTLARVHCTGYEESNPVEHLIEAGPPGVSSDMGPSAAGGEGVARSGSPRPRSFDRRMPAATELRAVLTSPRRLQITLH